MMYANATYPRRHGTAGFTLVEAVMSMLIVGLMLVAALNTVGASRVAQSANAEQAIGPLLAEDLMSEILGQAYQEPVDTPQFGRESESGGNRAQWDDVDDYDGWSAGPPEAKDGTALPDMNDWTREVGVAWAGIVDPMATSATPTGIKRITVTVKHRGRTVTTLYALRTDGWPEVGSTTPGDDGGGLLSGVLNLLF